MKYEELTYRRMLQVIRSSRTARLAVVQDGAPYVVPVCVCSRMDGCIPVFEVRAGNDGDLLTALASNAAVMLEFETPGHAGAVETVLVRGRAVVEQNLQACSVCSCGCGEQRNAGQGPRQADRWYAGQHEEQDARRYGAWPQSGRIRFDELPRQADRYTCAGEESCACSRSRENGMSCPLPGEGCTACSRRDSCGCAGRCAENRADHRADTCERREKACSCCDTGRPTGGCAAVITITAAEMTGRCYAACVARCRNMDWEG